MTKKMLRWTVGLALAALAIPGVTWAAETAAAVTSAGCPIHCPFCG